MLDFLFITSPTNARNPHPPYYFMYLASYLRNKGCKVKILDVKGGDKPEQIEAHFLNIKWHLKWEYKARFVCLAAFHSDYPMIMRLGKAVKHYQPDTTLLVGNAHATINPEDFIYKGSPFDIAVLGEGEETCWELWQVLYNKNPEFLKRKNSFMMPSYYAIKGIAFWDAKDNGKGEFDVVKTKRREFINLDNLPMPAYDLLDMEYYLRPQKLIIRRIFTSMVCIFAGRGCPFDCDFCAANVVWKANKGKAARLRPVDAVMAEITTLLQKYKIDFFYLFDDMFGMDKKWMTKWFERKKDLDAWNGISVPYACQTRADIASEEMIKGLKETGCIQVDIGVESGSQVLLDNANKKITLDQIRQVFDWCRKYKIRSFATMLLNLPFEMKSDLYQTRQFLEEIKPSAGMIFGITTPYPGTKIYERHCWPRLKKEEYGLLINNRLDPIERFRLCSHDIDLGKLWDEWNRHFKATPMFERMWCMKPFQWLYWKTVSASQRRGDYAKAMLFDLVKTFLLYWAHKLRIYKFLKAIQYGNRFG